MSRLPRSFWLGSSTSPLAMTSSYLSAGSAGSKPRGDGAPPPAWASWIGAWACAGVTAPAAATLPETMKSRRDRSMVASPLLAQLGAAVGDDVEERADLGVEDVDVGREETAGRGVAGDRLGPNRHHAHVADVAGGVDGLPLRVQQILLAHHDERLGLDGAQRLHVVTVHTRRGA